MPDLSLSSYAVEWKRLVPGTQARDSLVGLGMLAVWHLVFWIWGIWITAALGTDGTVCTSIQSIVTVENCVAQCVVCVAYDTSVCYDTGRLDAEYGAATCPVCKCSNCGVLHLLVRMIGRHALASYAAATGLYQLV